MPGASQGAELSGEREASSHEVGREDSRICCWMSKLAYEGSGGEPSVISVGIFSGEFTEEVANLSYLNNLEKRAVGAKQTARCQVIDCFLSKCAKDVLKKEQRTVRTRRRRRSAST